MGEMMFKREPQSLDGESPHQLQVSKYARFLMALISVCLMVWVSSAQANGLLEIVGGMSSATGGELKSSRASGGQLTLGWGGRLQSMSKGSALYGYGAVSLDHFTQTGPLDLGSPKLERQQIGLTVGARYYRQIADRLRGWLDLGFGYILDDSETQIVGLSATQLNTQSFTVTSAVGLQYRIESKLLLSLGYYQAFFTERDKMGLAERPLLSDAQNSSFGRGRFALGLGWSL